MFGATVLTMDVCNPITKDTVPRTYARGFLIKAVVPTTVAGGLIIEDTTLMAFANNMVVEATILVAGSSIFVIGPPATTTLVAMASVLVVYLKIFISHTKHLKIVYLKCFTCKILYLKNILLQNKRSIADQRDTWKYIIILRCSIMYNLFSKFYFI